MRNATFWSRLFQRLTKSFTSPSLGDLTGDVYFTGPTVVPAPGPLLLHTPLLTFVPPAPAFFSTATSALNFSPYGFLPPHVSSAFRSQLVPRASFSLSAPASFHVTYFFFVSLRKHSLSSVFVSQLVASILDTLVFFLHSSVVTHRTFFSPATPLSCLVRCLFGSCQSRLQFL